MAPGPGAPRGGGLGETLETLAARSALPTREDREQRPPEGRPSVDLEREAEDRPVHTAVEVLVDIRGLLVEIRDLLAAQAGGR